MGAGKSPILTVFLKSTATTIMYGSSELSSLVCVWQRKLSKGMCRSTVFSFRIGYTSPTVELNGTPQGRSGCECQRMCPLERVVKASFLFGVSPIFVNYLYCMRRNTAFSIAATLLIYQQCCSYIFTSFHPCLIHSL
jgi:hypothetical protein